jgi:Fe(3+) dicitrate transport protein
VIYVSNYILTLILFFSAVTLGQTVEVATSLAPVEVTDIFIDDLNTSYNVKQISKQRLKATATMDVHRAIKESPGVYAREEDGMGLRPNIGLRGTNPDRSKKIVILEDQILIGPAPYSAPAAYYTPSMMTTENLEIYKGFSALPYGPNSIGGAINYKTYQFDASQTKKIQATYGSFNTSIYNLKLQHQIDDTNLMLLYGNIHSDGFKKIDSGSKAQMNQNSFLVKVQRPILFFDKKHLLEFRFGYGDETSNETYLGLTQEDYENSYLRRYVASELDQMNWSHYKYQIEDLFEINSEVTARTQIYYHIFNRTWYRLDGFRDATKSIQDILKNPTGSNEPFYRILNGSDDSNNIGAGADINLTSNDRSYISQGLQSQVEFQNLYSDSIESLLKLKLLIHADTIQRKHDSDYYSMQSKKLVRTNDSRAATARNKESAVAYSLAAQDELKIDRFMISPQFRYEQVDFSINDHLNTTKNKSRNDEIFISGLALGYELTPHFFIKFAANQAATLSGLDSAGNEKREESINQEASVIWQNKDQHVQFEMTYFENDYKNITGTCTTSSGCNTAQLDQQFNGGKALIQGFESRLSKGFLIGNIWVPIQLNATFMNSEFKNNFVSTSPEWGAGEIKSGDPLPYVPTTLLNLVIGADYKKTKQSLSINYFGRIYDQSLQAGRTEIPSYGLLDYSVNYEHSTDLSFRFKIDNLLNKKYMAATKPFGYRPGKPQQFSIAAEFGF